MALCPEIGTLAPRPSAGHARCPTCGQEVEVFLTSEPAPFHFRFRRHTLPSA